MPTQEDIDSQTPEGGEPEVEQPVVTAQPTFSLEDVKNIVREAVVATQPVRQVQQYVEPTPEAPTDEEIVQNPRLAMEKEVARQLHPIRQQMTFGLSKIAEITDKAFSGEFPYRELYRTEIDAELSKMDPIQRTNKDVLRLVHDAVAMRHEKDRLEAARQEGLRQGRPAAPKPTGNKGPITAPEGTPTPEELGFSEELVNEIDARGGPDSFARTVSGGRYKNWSEYAQAKQRMDSSKSTTRGRIMPFARLEPKASKLA